MTDNMEKVSSSELFRTLHGAALKLEKMGRKGEKEKNMFMLGFVPTLNEKLIFRALRSTN